MISLLLTDDLIRSAYTKDIDGTLIFKQADFIDVFRYKDCSDNCYTR
ncbi:site-specific DNA-methyltransferase [Sporosarcina ureae]